MGVHERRNERKLQGERDRRGGGEKRERKRVRVNGGKLNGREVCKKGEKESFREAACVCARARARRVFLLVPCVYVRVTVEVYTVCLCVSTRERERERKKRNRAARTRSQHFIPLHSFLSSLGGSY